MFIVLALFTFILTLQRNIVSVHSINIEKIPNRPWSNCLKDNPILESIAYGLDYMSDLHLPKISDLLNLPINFENNVCHDYWAYPLHFIAPNCFKNEDLYLDMLSLLAKGNYSYSILELKTNDDQDFIIQVARMGYNDSSNSKKQSIVLIPGLSFGADVYLSAGDSSLAKGLVNQGYEVFLVAMRGTKQFYSSDLMRNKPKYNMSDPNFWDFNFDTLATIDIPVIVREISTNYKTNDNKLIILTHSFSIVPVLMYAAENSEAEKYLKGITALAPVVTPQNSFTMNGLSRLYPQIQEILKFFGFYQLFYDNPNFHKAATSFCTYAPYACLTYMNLKYGQMEAFAPEHILTYWAKKPDGISLPETDHLLQIVRSGQLAKFDYGRAENLKIYKQPVPPKYDLNNVKVNFLALYGKLDLIADEKDVVELIMKLGSPSKEAYPWTIDGKIKFNHVSFLYPKNGVELLIKPLSELLQRHFIENIWH